MRVFPNAIRWNQALRLPYMSAYPRSSKKGQVLKLRPNLDNLPRTVEFVRADDGFPYIPNRFPVLVVLDQSKLPSSVDYLQITDWREAIDAIRKLKVRGAPAIGIVGAAAVCLRAAEFVYASRDAERSHEIDFERVFVIDEQGFDPELYKLSMEYSAKMISSARPTAVNLSWAVDGALAIVYEELVTGETPDVIEAALFEYASQLIVDDENANRLIGEAGATLLPDNATILTHCNAGSLATGFYGTALGVVYSAAQDRGIARVYADETRPVLQGARLTSWELSRAGIPVTVLCDSMAASVMAEGHVDAVIVGADRIAANGDVANKVGTLQLAIVAKHFGCPVYVAAPTSTIDPNAADGSMIPIEQRSPSEVLPEPIEGVDVCNPSFDVTPACLVSKIVTEAGIFEPSRIMDAIAAR